MAEPRLAESSGFSLHAGILAKASQRDKLEHLARPHDVVRGTIGQLGLDLQRDRPLRSDFPDQVRSDFVRHVTSCDCLRGHASEAANRPRSRRSRQIAFALAAGSV
jgi:hypothetical protein